MQPVDYPSHGTTGAAPEPASLEIDLAFLEEFLGEDLDIDEPILPADDPLDLSSPGFRWGASVPGSGRSAVLGCKSRGTAWCAELTVLHRSHVANTLLADPAGSPPNITPFQRSLQQLEPPEPKPPWQQERHITPLQTAVRAEGPEAPFIAVQSGQAATNLQPA